MQTHPEEYDVVVLGSGEAGKYIAWTLARKGMRAIVIERKYIGGSCPNIACLPSNTSVHNSRYFGKISYDQSFLQKLFCSRRRSGCSY
jgi:pyruvate/2-oxoglutarate dehydrogenase complex dihydrolipoamide dehydrogenase (E3) component